MPDLGNTSVFSQTDASNNSGTQPSWSGAAAPSTLDDAGRGLQGAVTREWNWRNYTLTAGGTADAKTLTYGVAPAAYYNGQRFAFIANTTNTTSATLNVNGLGAKTIKSMATGTLTNLSASNMVAGEYVEVAYNLANDCFVWVNQSDILPQALGTGDSPQFAGVNIGDASDTTLTRASSGVLAVEGGVIPKENRANTFSATQTINNSSPAIITLTSSTANGGYIELFTDNATTRSYIGSHKGTYGTGNSTDLAIYNPNNITFGTSFAERMRLDSSGNVGVGISPSTRLHVYGADTELRVQSSTSANGYVRFLNTSGSMSIGMSGGATNTLLTYDRTNSQTAHEYLGGASGYHAWYTAGSERMRIDSSGNVSVGGTPVTKFDVRGPSGVTSFTGTTKLGFMLRASASTTDYTGIDFSELNGGNPYARIGMLVGASGSSLSFGTSNNYGLGVTNTAMTIDPSGNVGIGATPSYPLDVRASTGQVNVQSSTGTNFVRYLAQNTGGMFQFTIDSSTAAVFSNGAYSRVIYSDGAYPLITYTNGVERMRITSAGGVSFGSSGTAYGTTGQVLISQGNAPPVWGNAGAVLLGTLTTTSGTSQTLSSLVLTNYKFLRLVFNGVSGSSTGTFSFGTFQVSQANAAGDAWIGIVDVDLATGIGSANLGSAAGASTPRVGSTGYTTATTSVSLTIGLGNFDAGSVAVYGVA